MGWSKDVVYEVVTVVGAVGSVEVAAKVLSNAPLLRLNSSDFGGNNGATCDSKGTAAGVKVKWYGLVDLEGESLEEGRSAGLFSPVDSTE